MTDTSKATNPDPTGKATLREITADTVGSILNLSVSEDQERFVASNARSIAQAHFSEHAWFRAFYASEEPVGFVMLYDKPEKGEYSLWRFMIDARYQGRGYGRAALLLVIAHIRTRPKATVLYSSYVPGEGDPGGFYRSLGFIETGEVSYEERVLKLVL